MRVFTVPSPIFDFFNIKQCPGLEDNKTRPLYIVQLFRERLSEKVHATIPKGIVGGFVCPVLRRNLKEWHERPQTYVRKC